MQSLPGDDTTTDTSWPSAPGGESLRPPLSTQDLRSFAGEPARVGLLRPAAEYYVPRWSAALSHGAPHAGFNWAAAFFGSNWCFWRKLYGLGLVILAAELVTSVLLALILVEATGTTPEPGALGATGWAALLPVRALLGRYANTLYLSRAIESVAAAREEHATPEEQQALIANLGGTSWLVLGIALGLQLLLTFTRAISAAPGA